MHLELCGRCMANSTFPHSDAIMIQNYVITLLREH